MPPDDPARQAAIRGDHEELSRILDEAGPGAAGAAGSSGRSMFHHAIGAADNPSNHKDASAALCVAALAARGADPNQPDLSGQAPIHAAALRARPACMRALLAAGADPDAVLPRGSKRPIHLVAARPYSPHFADCVAALAQAGADIGAPDGDGRSALDIVDAPPSGTVELRADFAASRARARAALLAWAERGALADSTPPAQGPANPARRVI